MEAQRPEAALGTATDSPIARTLGIQVVCLDPVSGTGELTFHVDSAYENVHGHVQGGIVAAMLDAAMGWTVRATLERGQTAPSLDLQVQFLAPANLGAFTGRASVRRQGRRISFLDADLFDDAGTLVATATSTVMIRGAGPPTG